MPAMEPVFLVCLDCCLEPVVVAVEVAVVGPVLDAVVAMVAVVTIEHYLSETIFCLLNAFFLLFCISDTLFLLLSSFFHISNVRRRVLNLFLILINDDSHFK
jgi:hypothetical protein